MTAYRPIVSDLGVYIDADLTMRTHVQRTVFCCFATLRQLRTIRRSVPLPVFQLLVVALVLVLPLPSNDI